MKVKVALVVIPTLCGLIWFGLFYRGNLYASPCICTNLQFPELLSFPTKQFGLTLASGIDPLIFRRNAAHPARILVTAQSAVDMGFGQVTYAPQKYEFDLYWGGPLHSISDVQWQRGMAIQPVDDQSLPIELDRRNDQGLMVGFDQSGNQGTGASPSLSLDRRQVALPSYIGLYTTGILSQLPDHEFWYWDIFEIGTYKKRFTVKGLAMSIVVTDAEGSATWLPDSRLVLSSGNQRARAFLLCNLSNKLSR